MQLNQLWVFYHVAKRKSFSKAAEALFLSQPSVSNQVKLLEESYGLKLFDRSGRNIELTNPGEILLSYAERIFNLVKEADSVIEEIKDLKTGEIRISASNTLGAYYLPDILDLFRKKHPGIEIRMNVGYTQTVVEDILSFRSDLGLIGRAVAHPNIVAIPLWEEELVLIVAKDHPFASCIEIDPSELRGQPFIMSERGSGVREITEEILSKAGISPDIIMELGENEAIKRAVSSGLGMTIISAAVASRELERGLIRSVQLRGARISRRFYIIHHKDKYISRLIRAFMDEAQRPTVTGRRILPIRKKPVRARKPVLPNNRPLRKRGSV